MRFGGQRAKGIAFERKVANDLKAIFPNAKRGFQTRGGGKEQCDVEGTPYFLELKHCARVNTKAAWQQAEDDQRNNQGSLPRRPEVVVWQENRKKPQVMMRLADLAALAWDDNGEQLVTISYEDWLQLLKEKHG